MRWLSSTVCWALVAGVSLSSAGCGVRSYHGGSRSSSDIDQDEMPAYEPAPKPQHEDDDQEHAPPGNPMPASR